jgi:hypothetical protein
MFARTDQIIPDEIAKRLAAKYAAGATTPLAVLYWTGRVLPTSFDAIRREGIAKQTYLDSHAFEADMRALSDYFEGRPNGEHPTCDSVKSYGAEADQVVPWAYGKDVCLPWTR